jgi:hypothetical protein
VEAALKAQLTVSRFFETGSFSHGTGVRNFSDIDVFASLGGTKPDSSYTALTRVKDALIDRFPSTSVVIDRPAVKIKFAGGTETWEVIPAFPARLTGDDKWVYHIPGPSVGSGWIESAPDLHLKYVNECNQKPSAGNTKALARLIKAWKYFCSVPLSSFYLEMRCAQHVARQETYIHVWDFCWLLEGLKLSQLAAINDPKGASGRFHACSSDAKRDEALSKLDSAAGRARKALEATRAGDRDTAFYYLDLLFGGRFPSR